MWTSFVARVEITRGEWAEVVAAVGVAPPPSVTWIGGDVEHTAVFVAIGSARVLGAGGSPPLVPPVSGLLFYPPWLLGGAPPDMSTVGRIRSRRGPVHGGLEATGLVLRKTAIGGNPPSAHRFRRSRRLRRRSQPNQRMGRTHAGAGSRWRGGLPAMACRGPPVSLRCPASRGH